MKNVIKKINKKYPTIDAVPSEEFDGSKGGIWFKGTEETYINGLPVLDCSMVNEEFDDFLESLGLFGEPYDAGTLMAYKV